VVDGGRGASGTQLTDAAGAGPVPDAGILARRLEAGTFFWLDMTGRSTTEVIGFAAGLGLSEDASRHLLLTGQRAGLEVSGDDLRGVAFSAQPDESSLVEVNAVYTASFLVTVHDSPCLALTEPLPSTQAHVEIQLRLLVLLHCAARQRRP
jgi:Mg2+ and Co2+ transporter CorA